MAGDTDKNPLEQIAGVLEEEARNLVELAKDFRKRIEADAQPDRQQKPLEDIENKLSHLAAAVNTAKGVFEKEEETGSRGFAMREFAARGTEKSTPESKPGEERSFSNFLSQIGESVVESQQKLDQRSVEYLSSIQDRPYIPPTLFRIPKITAELKVALREEGAKGINVILFSDKRSMSELNEQSLKLEIAAVPPSPELLQALQDRAPRIDFLFDPLERKQVFDFLREQVQEIDKTQLRSELDRFLEKNNRDQVLIWPIEAKVSYLLLFAGEESDKDVGIWYLDTSSKALNPVLRLALKPKSEEDQNPLREFILALGQRQQALLRGRLKTT